MSERRVSLDIGSAGTPSTGSGSAGSGPREEADPRLAEQFRSRLAGGEPPKEGEAGPPTRPFDLFAGMAMPAEAPRAESGERMRIIEEAVSRMLVSDGSHGAAEVRIQVKDDLLPGTEVRVREQGGRLEVEFVAGDAETGAWLAANAEAIANELSQRLRREVRVLVRRGDEASGHVADSAQDARLPDGPASLFAHRPPGDAGSKDGES